MKFEEVIRLYEQQKTQPKVIRMGEDKRFDVDGTKFGVILDETGLHHKKEGSSVKCFNRILSGNTELKAEDKTLKTLFIEYEIDEEGNGTFKPSGLSTTEAGTWRINVKRLVFELDTNFLRFCYEHRETFKFLIRPSKDNKWIGRGICIPVCDLLNLHNMWEDYDRGEEFDFCLVRYFDEEKYKKMFTERLFNK
jgi:hypothetical protein